MNRLKINLLAAICIGGLVITGAEAPTFKLQLFISLVGFCMFAGAGWGFVQLIRKEGL